MNVHKILFSFGLFCGIQAGLFAAAEENIQDQKQEICCFTLDQMYQAVYDNDYAKILDWVEFITPEVNRPDHDGYTVLHIAAYTGSFEMTMILLAIEGIDINIVTPHEESAYDIAFEKGHFLVAKELLKRDAIKSLKRSEELQKEVEGADNFEKLESLLNQIESSFVSDKASGVVMDQQDEEVYRSVDSEEVSSERFFQENKGDEVMLEPTYFKNEVSSLTETEENEHVEKKQQVEEEVTGPSSTVLPTTDAPTKTWSETCCIS
jgi:hypothetical protein